MNVTNYGFGYDFRLGRRLVKFVPDFDIQTIVKGRVVTVSNSIGSYGMGGAGFFGIQLAKPEFTEWLVISLWAADGWIRLKDENGRFFALDNRCKENYNIEKLDANLHQKTLDKLIVEKELISLDFSNGMNLTIEKEPFFWKNWKFKEDDDFRRVVFLCKNAYALFI